MAIMRRELPSGTVRTPPPRNHFWSNPITSAALAALAVVVCYQLLAGALFWARVKIDDLRFGYPRSYQLDGYVGFGESNGLPTHIIALNLHRQVVVLLAPGDNPTQVTTIKGPYLYGTAEEYAPVTVRLIDVTGDGYPDLVLNVDRQQMVWVDDPRQARFRPLLAQERDRAAHVLAQAP